MHMKQNQNKPQNLIFIPMTLENGYKWEIIAYGVLVNGSPYTQKPGEEPKLTYGFNTATRIMMMLQVRPWKKQQPICPINY